MCYNYKFERENEMTKKLRYKNICKQILSALTTSVIILTSIGMTIETATRSVNAAATYSENDPKITQISATSRKYSYENYDVTYSFSEYWGGNRGVTIIFKNTGSELIENYVLLYDFCGTPTAAWGGEIKEFENGSKYLKNFGKEINLKPGQAVQIGYTLSENYVDFPDSFAFLPIRVPCKFGMSSTLYITNKWGNSSNIEGKIVLENNSDFPVNCWEYDFASNLDITYGYIAGIDIIKTPEGYKLKGVHSPVIPPNSSV